MISAHAFVFFVNAVKHVVTVEHFAKSQTLDVTLNKANFNKTDIPFGDISLVCPIRLYDEVSGVKAMIDFDEEKGDCGEFVFDIDEEPFENHQFLDPSFCLEDATANILSATVSINEKVVSEGPGLWEPYSMQHAIWR